MENQILDLILTNISRAAARLNTLNEAGILVGVEMNDTTPVIIITDKAFDSLFKAHSWIKDFSDYYRKSVKINDIYVASKSSVKMSELEVEDEIAE